MKRFLLYFLVVVMLMYVVTAATGYTYLYKAIWYNYADVDDYKIFPNRTVETGASMRWPTGNAYNATQPDGVLRKKLDSIETLALVVVRNDSLVYEEYAGGYQSNTISNSFSIAKSIVSLLTGFALQDGFIKSLDEPIKNYLPQFAQGDKAKITIRHLLTMTSGTDWDESYGSPFSITTEAYYGNDLTKLANDVNVVKAPGTYWEYHSGDTELLALLLEKATGKRLTRYASEKLWKPLYAEHDALWSLDSDNGMEKAYCCFNATARDMARIGSLMLHRGSWKGTPLLNKEFVAEVLKPVNMPDETGKKVDYYGMQWWILPERPGVFYARGILGQYVIVVPQKNTVVVRFGKERGPRVNSSFDEVYALTDWILNAL